MTELVEKLNSIFSLPQLEVASSIDCTYSAQRLENVIIELRDKQGYDYYSRQKWVVRVRYSIEYDRLVVRCDCRDYGFEASNLEEIEYIQNMLLVLQKVYTFDWKEFIVQEVQKYKEV